MCKHKSTDAEIKYIMHTHTYIHTGTVMRYFCISFRKKDIKVNKVSSSYEVRGNVLLRDRKDSPRSMQPEEGQNQYLFYSP